MMILFSTGTAPFHTSLHHRERFPAADVPLGEGGTVLAVELASFRFSHSNFREKK